MHWTHREGYTGAEVTAGPGSGVNWTGPRLERGPVRVNIGYEWPDTATHAMFFGTWEEAQPHLQEVNEFLAANGLPPARPNDGYSRLGTVGFDTQRWVSEKEAGYSTDRATGEARTLLEYRRNGTACRRREMLEAVVASGVADGWLLQPQDMGQFLALVAQDEQPRKGADLVSGFDCLG